MSIYNHTYYTWIYIYCIHDMQVVDGHRKMGSLAPGGAGRWNHYLAGRRSPYLVALFMRACCHYFLLLDEHWTRQGHVNTTTHQLSSNSQWFIKYLGVGGLWQLVFVIELVKVVSCVIAFPLHYWNGAADSQLCCLWTFFGEEDFFSPSTKYGNYMPLNKGCVFSVKMPKRGVANDWLVYGAEH